MQRIKKMMNEILAENTGRDFDTVSKATERDNFLTPEEALEFGIIDKVLTSRSEVGKSNVNNST